MKKLYRKLLSHPGAVTAVFALLLAVCALCKPLVRVNYDINDYLPKDSSSTVSLEVMNEEFDSSIPNARVMVKNVTLAQAIEMKQKLSDTEGVESVIWLDDSMDITVPLEIQDSDAVENYYKNGCALFTVTLAEGEYVTAVHAIRDLIGEENAMSGSAVSTAEATEKTISQISKIAVFAVLFVILVLILTTDSWLHPVLIMLQLGAALIINDGSNLIFGEISFITNAAGMILQLAVSLDYSVFLLHRYEECLTENQKPADAMLVALEKSYRSILSSGLTTVIGFLALGLMRFEIGPDLGYALAKGIAISLLCVFVLMPCLTVLAAPLLEKTRHRFFVPSFSRFGKTVCRLMIPMTALFFVIITPVYLASNSNAFLYGSSDIFGEETKYGSDTAQIETVFGRQDTYVLLVPNSEPALQQEMSEKLHDIDQVTDIISYVDTVGITVPQEYLEEGVRSQLISEKYSRMVLNVDADYEGEETFSLIGQIKDIAQNYYPNAYYLAGEGVSTADLKDVVTCDMLLVNLIAIGAVFAVLLLTLRSITLPVILVLAIETAIWFNLSIPYFMGNSVFYLAYLIISSVQLGATVDYAILMTDRYLEYRRILPKKECSRLFRRSAFRS